MNKAGGVLAIVAGVFGVIAAVVTLLAGGLASAFKAAGGSMSRPLQSNDVEGQLKWVHRDEPCHSPALPQCVFWSC